MKKKQKTVKLEKCKTVNITVGLHKKLRYIAVDKDKTLAQLVEELIKHGLNKI